MYNIHDLVSDLTKELNLTPEQQFLVTARIKRYVHSEKISVYSRIYNYLRKPRCKAKSRRIKNRNTLDSIRWIRGVVEQKVKTHIDMAKAEDKAIVTWNVGSHVYDQKAE